MPVIGVLLLLIQIAFAVHVVRTGREIYWIFIIIFLPAIGCLIYFITQIMPELGQSRTLRKAGSGLAKAIDPQRELRRRKEELAVVDTTENRVKLAEECITAGLATDAIELLEPCLRSGNENDPNILLTLAQAQFSAAQDPAARQTMEHLIAANPSFKSHDGHLLYARTLEALDLKEQALQEYAVLATSFPGEEARVRYGLLLQRIGQTEQARQMFTESLDRASRAPGYYRKKEQQWLKLAKQNL